MRLDQETQDVLQQGEMAGRLVNHESWQWAKDRWQDIVTATTSLETLDDSLPPEEYKMEAKARRKALSLVNSWIGEIEGMAAQHQYNVKALQSTDEDKLTTYLYEKENQNAD